MASARSPLYVPSTLQPTGPENFYVVLFIHDLLITMVVYPPDDDESDEYEGHRIQSTRARTHSPNR